MNHFKAQKGFVMTTRTTLLTAAAVLALITPAFAEEAMQDAAKDAAIQNATEQNTAFSQGIKAIKDWFGSDTPEQIEPASGTVSAGADDDLQVPPSPGVNAIEPAAGADEDSLQAPPRYYNDQSSAVAPNALPRATSFDGAASVAAFGDQAQPSAADMANIETAAGDGAIDTSKMDCAAILKAADEAKEGEVPDTALIEACETETPVDASMPAATPTEPAQPGFEPSSMPQPLPSTQPAAGEPPIGGAVMPGGNPAEQPSEEQ